jgi:hypothetical protein
MLITYFSGDPTEKCWVIYGIREPQSENPCPGGSGGDDELCQAILA